MRQGPQSKSIFVQVRGIAHQSLHEIAGAYVVNQIAEKVAAKGVITKILNYRSAVSVRVRFLQLLRSAVGKALQKQRLDGIVPSRIHMASCVSTEYASHTPTWPSSRTKISPTVWTRVLVKVFRARDEGIKKEIYINLCRSRTVWRAGKSCQVLTRLARHSLPSMACYPEPSRRMAERVGF